MFSFLVLILESINDSIADGDTIIRESVGFLCRDDTDAPIA